MSTPVPRARPKGLQRTQQPAPPQQPLHTVGPPNPIAVPAPLQSAQTGDIEVARTHGIEELLTTKRYHELNAEAQAREAQLPYLQLVGIELDLYTYEDLVAESVVEITNTNLSGDNSVNDPLMGVVDDMPARCTTCNRDRISCYGHFGRIEFKDNNNKFFPRYHQGYLMELAQILSCVCNCCAKLLIPYIELVNLGLLRLGRSQRLREMKRYSEGRVCTHDHNGMNVDRCLPNPEYDTKKIKELKQIWTKKPAALIPLERVASILDQISDSDATLLGFSARNHPRKLTTKGIAVLPPGDRQPARRDGEIIQHPWTLAYVMIVKCINTIKSLPPGHTDREEELHKLDTYLGNLIDNSDANFPNQKIPMEGFKQVLPGKEGLIRGNMMGKRVNQAGRTVASPAPTIQVNEVSIPESMAKTLTQNEVINQYNIKRMTDLLESDRISYIMPFDKPGSLFPITGKWKNRGLHIGDTVRRHLQDGDRVLLNRQPTLHKYGFMAPRIRIKPGQTIGMPIQQTGAYNADFER